jgi:hypothetical protein
MYIYLFILLGRNNIGEEGVKCLIKGNWPNLTTLDLSISISL